MFWSVICLMVLAYLVAGLCFNTNHRDWVALAYIASLTSICCMLGAYAGLGSFFLRWPLVASFSPVLGWLSDALAGGRSLVEFEIFVIGMIGVTAITTLILRALKGNLVVILEGESHVDALQFRIKDLLIWTTVVAIVVALSQAILKSQPLNVPGNAALFLIFGLAVSMSVATVVNIWAMFGKQITPVKLLVVLVVTFASAAGCYYCMPSVSFLFSAAAIINQVVAVTMMYTLRRQGYRFVKRTRNP